MQAEIVSADDAREVLVNVMQLDLYAMSDFSGEDVVADGRFPYTYLEHYFRRLRVSA